MDFSQASPVSEAITQQREAQVNKLGSIKRLYDMSPDDKPSGVMFELRDAKKMTSSHVIPSNNLTNKPAGETNSEMEERKQKLKLDLKSI